ncbi:5-methylcytosine restriction system specificity protein McrC [Achromobacter dolens]|uniref:5-methylcytosine restriction system specificity protein McrC n=1 Tax=Achromobacter dolens TaxID=1287738 RepID=UPI0006C090D7|nr:hypothetical protein [Achromobacter dolens]CUI86937.1 5-methylcytosine-specific restriction enzyme subunit McrC [Achromobacter dolens]
MILPTLAPDGVLDLSEHETIAINLTRGESDQALSDVAEALSAGIAKGLVSVTIRSEATGAAKLVITTNSTVGFASSRPRRAGAIFVRVRPKVGTRRMLELAALAGILPNWTPGEAFLSETLEDALVEWTLRAYAHALNHLLAVGGLRNSHERIRRQLDGRLRGRLLVGPWLRNVARGAPHYIPAEFPSLERDNTPNRLLRWAIHLGILAARQLRNGKAIAEQLRRIERHFSGVSVAPPRGPLLDLRALPPNHRHYSEALKLARYVVENIHLGGEAGDHQGTAIALDMNHVYERAFFQGLRMIEPNAVRQEAWTVALTSCHSESSGTQVTRETRMIPDVYVSGDVESGRMPVLIDTKWKKVIWQERKINDSEDLLNPAKLSLVRVRPEDLYQATAYALEVLQRAQASGHLHEGCVTALVYPSLDDVPALGREVKFGGSRIVVRLVGWNVAQDARSGIETVWRALQVAAEGSSAIS